MALALPLAHCTMRWENSLTVSFIDLDYDFVLTSPPFINTELYAGMTPFANAKAYYTDFLIPLLDKCRLNVARNGHVCFHLSHSIYAALTGKHKYELCEEVLPILAVTVQSCQSTTSRKSFNLYVWRPL